MIMYGGRVIHIYGSENWIFIHALNWSSVKLGFTPQLYHGDTNGNQVGIYLEKRIDFISGVPLDIVHYLVLLAILCDCEFCVCISMCVEIRQTGILPIKFTEQQVAVNCCTQYCMIYGETGTCSRSNHLRSQMTKWNRRGIIFQLSVRPCTNVHYLRTSWKNDLTRSDQSLALPSWLFLIFEYSKFFGECLEWLIAILAWWCNGCPPLILHQFPASERSVNVRAFMLQIWKKNHILHMDSLIGSADSV